MKKLLIALASAAALLSSSSASALDYAGKRPLLIHASPGAPCVSFQLDGVPVSDPALPNNNPWFSLRKDHEHFAELLAMLLTAKAANIPITVATSGSSCGNAGVAVVLLQ